MNVDDHKIMIVDDEEDILRIIQIALQKYGFRVEAYFNPRNALDRLSLCLAPMC